MAQNIYSDLVGYGYKVFFSKITLKNCAGEDFEPIIYSALHSSKVMILLASCTEFADATWVKNEWSRYLRIIEDEGTGNRHLLPIRIDNMQPGQLPKELQRIQSLETADIGWKNNLYNQINKYIPIETKKTNHVEGSNLSESQGLMGLAKRYLQLEDWDRAKRYFEDVQKFDLKNAEAIMGTYLAHQKCKNLQEYENLLISVALDAKESLERITVDDEYIGALGQYVVEGYFSVDDIIHFIPSAKKISKSAEELESNYSELKRLFDGNTEMSLAFQYAKGEYADKLNKFRENVLSTVEEALSAAKKSEKLELEKIQEQIKAEYAAAEQQIKEQSEKMAKLRDSDYQTACDAMDKRELKKAISLFDKLGSYKDSEQRCTNAMEVNKYIEEIGDGKNYLSLQLALRHPEQTNTYIDACRNQLNFEKTKYQGKKFILCMIGFVLLELIGLGSGVNGAAQWLTIFSAIAMVVLWKKNMPGVGYGLFGVVNVLTCCCAGSDTSFAVGICIAIVLIVSRVRSNGYVHWKFEKAKGKKTLATMRKNVFSLYEKEFRKEVDDVWMEAFHTNYDGPQLIGISEFFEQLEKTQGFDAYIRDVNEYIDSYI